MTVFRCNYFFTVYNFFWWAFEQAGRSTLFLPTTILNEIWLVRHPKHLKLQTRLYLVPMVILTYVLYELFRKMLGK